MPDNLYNDAFFAFHQQRSRASAREIVPWIFQYVRPNSVVDVGCGIGTWLVEFNVAGVRDIVGVDGAYVDRSKILVDQTVFVAHDLTQPLDLGRRFDLAVSLEVAEHLPSTAAGAFVHSLTRLSPVVLFSAAIPHDSGDGHVNEQFPEYWQERFLAHNFVVVDCLRRVLWNNPQVATYYRQDIMFFVDRNRLGQYPRLREAFEQQGEHPPLSYVHPETYLAMAKKMRESQCLAMRHAARLREINLVVFPDWSHTSQAMMAELNSLFCAIFSHPDRERIALVVNISGSQEEQFGRILSLLIAEISRDFGLQGGARPEICPIGNSFGPDQWEVLMACAHYRIPLRFEDQRAVRMANAENCRMSDLAEIQNKQRFNP